MWDNTWEPVKLMKNQVLATVEGFDKILDREYLDGPMSYEQALGMYIGTEKSVCLCQCYYCSNDGS